MQDAPLVVAVLDWVLAEFVRMYHSVPLNIAMQMVENIITRSAPAIQDFDGFLKVLRTDLGASDFVLLLLYAKGSEGAALEDIRGWVRPTMRSNLGRTLRVLDHDKSFIHGDERRYRITRSGQQFVEAKRLMDPGES